MTTPGTITILDASNESSSFQVNLANVTAGNFAASQTYLNDLWLATAPIVLGNRTGDSLGIKRKYAGGIPADDNAQRERKWLVLYQDTTEFLDPPTNLVPNPGFGKKFTFEIPTADFPGHMLGDTDFADLTNAEIAAWMTVFEGQSKSPYGGTPNVLQITGVGRNS